MTHAPNGDQDNINYLRAALNEEYTHAALFRSLLGFPARPTDPVQTFYFPAGTFDTLTPFIATLEALENAFIGAYLLQFTSSPEWRQWLEPGSDFTSGELAYFSEVSASIMGVECEHRVLDATLLPKPQPITATTKSWTVSAACTTALILRSSR